MTCDIKLTLVLCRKGPFFMFSLSISTERCPFLFQFHCEYGACLFFFHALKTIGFAFCFRSLFLFFLQFFSLVFFFLSVSYIISIRQQLFATVNVYVNQFCSYCCNCCLNGTDAAVHWFLIICIHISLHRQLHTLVLCFVKWTAVDGVWCILTIRFHFIFFSFV